MTAEQLHILQHSLGVDQYGRGRQYRNRFVTGPGSTDFPICCELVEMGFMVMRSLVPILPPSDKCFFVTDEGKAAMREHSPKPPRKEAA